MTHGPNNISSQFIPVQYQDSTGHESDSSTRSSHSDTISVEEGNSGSTRGGRWTSEEHAQFLEGFKLHGKDWKRISNCYVPTRSNVQVRTHSQKHWRSHPADLAVILAQQKQARTFPSAAQVPAAARSRSAMAKPVRAPEYQPLPLPLPQQQHLHQQQLLLPMLNERFLAYLKHRVIELPGPLFRPFA
ncbi:hypothetical protein BASA81_007530 [Batrachochytrium salamandrivorans]|nr:hypothetical protein BASA81_007530 [Batrachochytrium salamandrivorans]